MVAQLPQRHVEEQRQHHAGRERPQGGDRQVGDDPVVDVHGEQRHREPEEVGDHRGESTCIQAGHSRLTGAQNQWPRRTAIGSSAARVGPQRRVGRHQEEKARRGLVEIGRLHRRLSCDTDGNTIDELLALPGTAATTQASPSFEEHDERRHEPGHPRRQALDEPALHPHPLRRRARRGRATSWPSASGRPAMAPARENGEAEMLGHVFEAVEQRIVELVGQRGGARPAEQVLRARPSCAGPAPERRRGWPGQSPAMTIGCRICRQHYVMAGLRPGHPFGSSRIAVGGRGMTESRKVAA